MADYRSSQQLGSLADLIGTGTRANSALIEQNEANKKRQFELEKMVQEKALAQQQQQENMQTAQNILDQYSGQGKRVNVGLTPGGGVNLGEGQQDDVRSLLQLMALQNTAKERDEKKVERLQEDVTKSGAPQAVESLKRVERSVPGAFSGKAKFKSVGGLKNLIPNTLVPVAEKAGVLPPGSSDERAALQEAQNAKIYDSSGKQINESEMKRIQQSMGLSGMFDPSALNSALQQVGNTVLQKNTQVTAGYPEQAVETFKGRGGITGAKSLEDLLGRGSNPLRAPTPMPTPSNPNPTNAPIMFDPDAYLKGNR